MAIELPKLVARSVTSTRDTDLSPHLQESGSGRLPWQWPSPPANELPQHDSSTVEHRASGSAAVTVRSDAPACRLIDAPGQAQLGSLEIARAQHQECVGTAFERGFQKGLHDRATLKQAIADQVEFFGAYLEGHPELGVSIQDLMARWRKMAGTVESRLQVHTPTVYAELQGAATVPGVDKEDLLLRLVEYDLYMSLKVPPGDDGKCTGVLWVGPGQDGVRTLVAEQTNDEAGESGGAFDGSTAYVDPNGVSATVYSRTGIPAYMGINSNGVAMLWQYIDDGRRDYVHGLPTYALIREALTKPSAAAALRFLESTPHMVPNNFQLGTADEGAFNVEVFPKDAAFAGEPTAAVQWTQTGYVVHANHIEGPASLVAADGAPSSTTAVDALKTHDISVTVSTTSQKRFAAAHHYMRDVGPTFELDEAQGLLSTPPIWRDPAGQAPGWASSVTYASVLMTARQGEEADGSLRLRLANDPEQEFRRTGVGQAG